MRAVVKKSKGVGFISLEEVEKPRINPDEVLIKVKAAGVCGTDIHIYHDEHPYWPPVILGHEFSGEIAQVGTRAKSWKVGERVVSEASTRTCGVCELCRSGDYQMCPEKRAPGWGIDGAFTEYIKMPAVLLHRIPESVSFEEAALTEPTAVTVHALLERSLIEPEAFTVVQGCGPIGLLAAQLAKSMGASRVMITGISQDVPLRLKLAKDLAIDYVVNVEKEDVVAKVKELTGGQGADLIVEASGKEKAINQSLEMIRRQGLINVLGITGKERINLGWDRAVFASITVSFSFSSNYLSWERALSMIAEGKIKVKPLITAEFPLEDWQNAFSQAKAGQAVKALLVP